MPKILWVALPLLRRRRAGWPCSCCAAARPRGTAINSCSSVLLLAYVRATAGLGIFWVANQQLPVFDWHYLFGYGTVLLVTLHLVFNFPAVWRFFARRSERDREAAPSNRPPPRARPGAACWRRSACWRRPARRSCWGCAMAAAS